MRLPLYIEFSGKKVAIIGGGDIGSFRAKKFADAGAEVTVYSLEFSSDLIQLEKLGKVRLVSANAKDLDYEEILPNYDLVVVALADKSLNSRIIEVARKFKVLVNIANDANVTEVVVPIEGKVGEIRFAITSEGKSSIAARKAKEIIEETLKRREDLKCLLEVMDFVKFYMKGLNIPVDMRMRIYSSLSRDENFLKLVNDSKKTEAKEYAKKYIYNIINKNIDLGEVVNF